MKDTPDDIQYLYRTLLMNRSGVERLVMGCAMFDASRALAKASLQAHCQTAADLRVGLFVRTYTGDFDSDTHR